MTRPKRGEAGYEESNLAWKKTMEERYGGADGVHAFMQKIGREGGKAVGYKGFATNPELARIAGAKGGSISRKSGSSKIYLARVKRAKELAKAGVKPSQMVKELGVSYVTILKYLSKDD